MAQKAFRSGNRALGPRGILLSQARQRVGRDVRVDGSRFAPDAPDAIATRTFARGCRARRLLVRCTGSIPWTSARSS